jgi:hypothetical protein
MRFEWIDPNLALLAGVTALAILLAIVVMRPRSRLGGGRLVSRRLECRGRPTGHRELRGRGERRGSVPRRRNLLAAPIGRAGGVREGLPLGIRRALLRTGRAQT